MSKKKLKVAFQGSPGAYSEMALKEYFGDSASSVGFELSEQVCEAVRDGEVDYGVLPIENSIVGNVDVNSDMFYHHDIYAIGEHFLRINHCLLGLKKSKLSDIKTVHSHPVALAQCRDFLNRHKIKAIADFDTAGACKLLIEKKDIHQATIASKLCADYYNLDILEDKIQKVEKNITRFLIFQKGSILKEKIKEEKTSLAFSVNHNPGALLTCLQKFAKYKINLSKLESRPIPQNPFEYIFYVDFLGAINDQNVKNCISNLKEDTNEIKILGSYPLGKSDV